MLNALQYSTLQMESEFLDIDQRNAWNTVFHEIRNQSNNFSHIIKDAKKMENKNLNRYRDVNPFDHSRVRLQRGEKDYINASLVNVQTANRSYILTQGPLPFTTGHFWLMVWEQKSRAILMLNRLIERNAVKCHQYWPIGKDNGGEDELLLSDVNLKIVFLGQENQSYFTVRKFLLSDLESENSREILQFHYTTWPDFGVPESPAAFLNFLYCVRKSGALNSNVGPPVVHCSAGIGRSGTFCLVDSCLVLIENTQDLDSINVRQQLLEMRHYRMGLIQTPDQLRFSYQAIIEGARRLLHKTNNENVFLDTEIANINQVFKIASKAQKEKSDQILCHDKAPPPLPPRSCQYLGDSLHPSSISNAQFEQNGQLKENTNMSTCALRNDSSLKLTDDCHCVLQDEDSIPGSTSNQYTFSNFESTEIRKRARKEREEKTATLVNNIKKKQQESECKGDNRRSIFKIIGLVFVFGVGYFLCKNFKR